MCASLLSVEHLILLLIDGGGAGGEGSALVVNVQVGSVDVPQDERARVHVVAGAVDRAPPAADLARSNESVCYFGHRGGTRAANLPRSCRQGA